MRERCASEMHRTHDQQQSLACERLETEIVVLQRTGQASKRQIDFAAMQQLHDLIAGFAENAHVQQRMPSVFSAATAMTSRSGAAPMIAADGQLSMSATAFDVEIFGKIGSTRRVRAAHTSRDHAERNSGRHAACVAFEQQEAERFLDVAEHAARAGLRDVDRLGGLMEIARASSSATSSARSLGPRAG